MKLLEQAKYRHADTFFANDMFESCGKEYLIYMVGNLDDDEEFIDYCLRNIQTKQKSSWTWSRWMFDVVKEFAPHRDEEREKAMSKVEDQDWETIKEEMKSKIDRQKIIKIIAGSCDIRMKDVQGIDTILEDWAEAKKHTYLDLGRNISITKKCQIAFNSDNFGENLEFLKEKFPKYAYTLIHLSSSELINNEYYGDNLEYIHQYFPEIKRRNEAV